MPIESEMTAKAPRILFAENDALPRAELGARLREAGYEVIEASDGGNAMDLAIEHEPELAIVCQQMRDCSGVDLARMLNAQSRMALLFMSSSPDCVVAERAIDAGAVVCLAKPIKPSQLLQAVRAILRRELEMRALRSQAEKLDKALQNSRAVNVATGLLMGKLGLTQQAAFENLRQYARSHRLRIDEVAGQLLRTVDEAGMMIEALGKGAPSRAPAARPAPNEVSRENRSSLVKISNVRRKAG